MNKSSDHQRASVRGPDVIGDPGYAFTTVPPFTRTTKRVASIVQFGFGVEVKDPDHQLARAMEAVHAVFRTRCSKSEFVRMDFSVDDDD